MIGDERKAGRAGTIYFEFKISGSAIKTTAIDARSGTEVSIVAPKMTPQQELEQLAAQKLDYVLRKQERMSQNESDDKRGIIV